MIIRSILFAGVLFLLYNLVLLAPPLRERFITQSQWQDNMAKAQEYPLAKPSKQGVIVGSSLAERLSTTSLQTDFYNLSMSGEGPFTGLEIIRRNAIRPGVVLIETNLLLREENTDVLGSAFCPVISQLRPVAPGLLERYHPANFIAGKVGEKLVHWSLDATQWLCPKPKPKATEDAESVFEKVLAIHKAEYEILPKPGQIEQQIKKLKAFVADLEARGTRCVFVEMPIDNSLTELPQPAAVRNSLREAFPQTKYLWVNPDGHHRYATVDGVHLPGSEADAYAERIRTELGQHGLLK